MIDWSGEPNLARLRRAHQLLGTDPVSALVELASLADAGSVMSMIYLGNAHKLGTGTHVDLSQAEHWYRRAAERGSIPAYYDLGRLYLRRQRYDDAMKAFQTAADKGYIPALHFLGRMYFYGLGIPRNIPHAAALLERASTGGSIYARRILGQILVQSHSGVLGKLRGVWLLFSGALLITAVLLTQGLASDQLR